MKKIKKMKIRTKMLLIMFLTVGILLGTVTILIYRNTEKTIENQALYSFEENAQKTCAVLDTRMDIIKESTEKMNLDTRLYTLFRDLNEKDALSLTRASKEIASILRNYIPWYSDIYSAHLVTSYYRFGSDQENYYPNFTQSEVAQKAYKAKGKSVWIPTYSYTDMYHISNLTDDQIPYGKLFTVARQMNLSDVTSGKVQRLSTYAENPVLVINFKPGYMESVLTKYSTNNSLDDTQYYIISEDGTVVYSTDERYAAGENYQAAWLSDLEKSKIADGFFIKENGQKELLSYSRSNVTGWLVVMKIPVKSLVGGVQKQYLMYLLMAFLVMLAVAAVMAWALSAGINRQIYRVVGVIDKIGEGQFIQKIEYDDSDEFAFFYRKVERMGNAIATLIHENYEVKLIQKDTEIKALNAQLNPHFIYNTLNIINWACLEGNMKATSQMIVNLSRMLHYTSHHTGLYEQLKNDVEWMERYLYIMQIRFVDKFKVEIQIPDELLDMLVPKLFLQPFVENAIVHGFRDTQEDGLLEISAECEDENIIFYVEDNGCGMPEEKIQEIKTGSTETIGIANVNQRLKILYGEQYGVECHSQMGEGTMIMIVIPKRNPEI